MSVNQIKQFANGGSANTLTPAAYAALTALLSNGFASGVANSAQLNTVWRQSSFIAAMLAQFIADQSGQDVNDDGNVAGLEAKLVSAINAVTTTLFSANQSLGVNGHVMLPGGFILQYGLSPAISSGGSGAVTFPITFPSSAYSVFTTYVNLGTGGALPAGGNPNMITVLSTSGFTIANGGSTSSAQFFWFSLGK